MSTNYWIGPPAFPPDDDMSTVGYEDPEWLEKWTPTCPDGNPQRLCEILGFRLKGPDYLQLRVVLTPRDRGVCQIIMEAHPDRLYVRALACLHEDEPERDASGWRSDETDCPCRVWLDEPLGEKVVIDVDSGEPLPLFIPRRSDDEPSRYVPRPSGNLWPPRD